MSLLRGPDNADVLARLASLLERLEHALPPAPPPVDWSARAYRWRKREVLGASRGYVESVANMHDIRLDDLQGIDRQRDELARNTLQFVDGRPANNALLTGSRGTGKSSLVKALVNEYAGQGLRVLEVDKHDLVDLGDIIDALEDRPERFIVFCDDLSFEADDASYKALKAILDGSVYMPPDNMLLYATSNRRHLLPEYMADNLEAKPVGGEIHHGEAVEEKISLSDRFGLWLTFYPFKQEEFVDIARHWLRHFEVTDADSDEARAEALRWALARGTRSGRSAYQFARDYAGRTS